MSKFGLMVMRCIKPDSVPFLIDLGYLDEKASRDRADAIMAAGISRKNVSIEGHRRLLIRLPPRKAQAIFDQFPIVKGETYFMATHHWRGLGAGEKTAAIPR